MCILTPRRHLSCRTATNVNYYSIIQHPHGSIQDDVSNKYALVHFLNVEGKMSIILRNKISFANCYCVKK